MYWQTTQRFTVPLQYTIIKAYKTVKNSLSCTPTSLELHIILQRIGQQAQDIKNAAKVKEWHIFIQEMKHQTSLMETIKGVNIIRAKNTRETFWLHEEGQGTYHQMGLSVQPWWTPTARLTCALHKKYNTRIIKIRTGCDVRLYIQFTETELTTALKPRKSTAPEIEDIKNEIVNQGDNPLLCLYGLKWATNWCVEIYYHHSHPQTWQEWTNETPIANILPL